MNWQIVSDSHKAIVKTMKLSKTFKEVHLRLLDVPLFLEHSTKLQEDYILPIA